MQERINAFKLLFGFEPKITDTPTEFILSFSVGDSKKGIYIQLLLDGGGATEEKKIECFDACMRRAKTTLFYD